MKEIVLVGKSVLGEKGFCLIPEKMTDENGSSIFYSQLDKIKEIVGREVFSIAAVSSFCDIEEMEYDYLPSTILYNEGMRWLVDPYDVFMSEINGTEPYTPNVDFIIWDSTKHALTPITFSKTAPIIYMESKKGMCCLGVIMRKSLLKHGIYIFEKILKVLSKGIDDPVSFTLCTCTNKYYDDMGSTIDEYIRTIILGMDRIKEYSFLYNVELNDECYNANDRGNHVIVIK